MALRYWDDLLVFLRVTELGSFSAAARDLNRTAGAVSKQVARLEHALNVRLFERNTRTVRLTDEGSAVISHARHSAAHIDRIVEIAARSRGLLEGSIRLTAPAPFGRKYVAQAIAEFCTLHPAVHVELQLSDRVVDLLHGDMDLALRIGELRTSGLLARRLSVSRRVLVAAPDYLKRSPALQHPQDLAVHQCLLFAYPGTLHDVWQFTHNKRSVQVQVQGAMRSDNGDVLRTWCCAGLGVSLREAWDVVEELQAGTLLRVLPQWEAQAAALYAVRAPRDPLPQRIAAFIEFLAQRWHAAPWVLDGKRRV